MKKHLQRFARLASIILTLAVLANLSGCGQTGALYLPTKTAPTVDSPTTNHH